MIYLDMDGVIVDLARHFHRDACRVLHKYNRPIPKGEPQEWSFGKHYGMSDFEVDEIISGWDVTEWSELPETPWAQSLVNSLSRLGPIAIYSAAVTYPEAATGKLMWLRSFFRRCGWSEADTRATRLAWF